MTTLIDRESVERPWASPMLSSLLEQMANQPSALSSYVIASGASMAITEIRALRAALDAAEAENKRLREALTEIDNLSPGLSTPSEYARGWNEGRWRAKNIARAALQENPNGLG